jgi:DNA-binding transcriptional regulator YhcF (GntR family)
MTNFEKLFTTIRNHVISDLHTGHLGPGDQLPSVRDWVAQTGANARAVMRVYHLLEQQGLVEVRGRSGVYLAEQMTIGHGVLKETGQWLVEDVLAKAWKRRIRFPDLPRFIQRCTASVRLRCAVLDAMRDQREAVAAEISADFGMEAFPVEIPAAGFPLADGELDLATRLGEELRGVDLLVTTTFHAAEVLDAADRLDKPAAIVQFNPLLVSLIERHLEKGPLTFVVLDPRYVERLQIVFGRGVRAVAAHDRAALARLDRRAPVVVSRAAQPVVKKLQITNLLPADVPVIAPDCAREIAHWLVHLNLGAAKG